MSEIGRIAWNRWKIVGEAFGDFQGRLFAVLFYFSIFVPFALGVRLLSDPLNIHNASKVTRWLGREAASPSLDNARRQF